jgi:hypothetical protein
MRALAFYVRSVRRPIRKRQGQGWDWVFARNFGMHAKEEQGTKEVPRASARPGARPSKSSGRPPSSPA